MWKIYFERISGIACLPTNDDCYLTKRASRLGRLLRFLVVPSESVPVMGYLPTGAVAVLPGLLYVMARFSPT
jgi:hypothetical protein